MRRLLLLLALSPATFAVDRQFGDIVRAISDEFHTKPTRIPFFGLVNVVAFVARPAGYQQNRVTRQLTKRGNKRFYAFQWI